MKFAERKRWTVQGDRIQEFPDREKEIIKGYTEMPEEDLILIEKVEVTAPKKQVHGRPTDIVVCDSLERMYDHKETAKGGHIFCKPCAYGAYCQREPRLLRSACCQVRDMTNAASFSGSAITSTIGSLCVKCFAATTPDTAKVFLFTNSSISDGSRTATIL